MRSQGATCKWVRFDPSAANASRQRAVAFRNGIRAALVPTEQCLLLCAPCGMETRTLEVETIASHRNHVETRDGNPKILPVTGVFASISPPHNKTRRKDPKGRKGTG